MKKEIDAWVWNPANSLFKQKKSEKAIGHIIYCECPEKCELYAKGYCVAFDNRCPYGSRGRVTGYSRMANKFHSWIMDFEQAQQWYDGYVLGCRLKEIQGIVHRLGIMLQGHLADYTGHSMSKCIRISGTGPVKHTLYPLTVLSGILMQ